MIQDSQQFYLPNLYTFQNGNTFYGSFRSLRFRVKPQKSEEETSEAMVFRCSVWYGEYCMEESELAAEAEFPLDEAGYAQVLSWLDAQYQRCAG